MDIGATDRKDVVAPVRLLLNALLEATPDAAVKSLVVTNVDTPGGETVAYAGTPAALLSKFHGTNMLGLEFFVPGSGFILVFPPKAFLEERPYWQIVADAHRGWLESQLNEIIRHQGIQYAAITTEETIDLEWLRHGDESKRPWDHWRLVAARFRKR
jgi:hypothetical protein